jgi:hypothetical protein
MVSRQGTGMPDAVWRQWQNNRHPTAMENGLGLSPDVG